MTGEEFRKFVAFCKEEGIEEYYLKYEKDGCHMLEIVWTDKHEVEHHVSRQDQFIVRVMQNVIDEYYREKSKGE